MKLAITFSRVIIFLSLIVLFQACLKKEFEDTLQNEETYEGFEFKTVSEYSVDVTLLNSQNNPISSVYTLLFTQNPLNSNGVLLSNAEENRIFQGISDKEGKISCEINPPSYVDSLFILVMHIGLPELTVVPLNAAQINVTIGGKTTKSAPVNKSGFVTKSVLASPQKVNGFYTLGTWNNLGVPNYLELVDDIVSNDLLADITASLPENEPLTKSHPQYLTKAHDANLVIKESCEVWVTFVHEGAGWLNVLGYYTYPSNVVPKTKEDIENLTVIFPNVSYAGSGGGLVTGNKVQLQYLDTETNTYTTTFPEGVTIGWFLIAQGWTGSTVGDGIYAHYSDVKLNLESNENLRKHNVLLYDKQRSIFILGFEDIRRDWGSDDDFNDAVFYASLNPITAVDTDIYESVDTPEDTDRDGISDMFDDYDNDPDKAFNNYYPGESTFGTLVFEDLWPYKGDYDFNDLVIDYNFNQITNAENEVTGIKSKIVVRAIGASYHNAFGLELNTPPGNVVSVTGLRNTKGYFNISSNGTEVGQSNAVIILFDDAYNALPYPGEGISVNTYPQYPYVTPDTMEVNIVFNNPVAFSQIGTPPYNPFMIINRDRSIEVHLPNNPPTDLANLELMGTGQDNSNVSAGKYYVSDKHLPWAINIPESFNYPIEKESIVETYLVFDQWALSMGYTYMDWFKDLSGYRDNSKIYSK